MKSGALTFVLLVIPLVLLDLNTVAAWHSYPDLFPRSAYLKNDFLLWAFSLELFVLAFLAFKRERKVVSRLLMLLTGFLWLVVAADLFVLFLCHQSSGPGGKLCLSHRNWFQRYVKENSMGYWEDEPVHGTLPDFAIIGDSFTWGQGLPGRQDPFTDILARQFANKARLWNFARGGTNTQEQMNMILPQVLALHPKTVMICYLGNDVQDTVKLMQTVDAQLSFWERRWLVASPAYNYLYWKVLKSRQDPTAGARAFFAILSNYLDAHAFERHHDDISQYVRQIKASGARPIAVILPFPHLWSGINPGPRAEIYARIRKAFEDAGAPVIELQDLETTFPPGHFEVNSMDAHPSVPVQAALAERIGAWLQQHPDAWQNAGLGK